MSYGISIKNSKNRTTFQMDGSTMRVLYRQLLTPSMMLTEPNNGRVMRWPGNIKVHRISYLGLGTTCFADVRPTGTKSGVVLVGMSGLMKSRLAWKYINVGLATSAVEIWDCGGGGGSYFVNNNPLLDFNDRLLIIYTKGNI